MAKLQVYKFVNPGTAASASPAVTAARSQVLATNRLGSTISSIGNIFEDLEKIAIAQIKDDDARAKAERRRERRELDASTEQAVEQSPDLGKVKKKPGGKLKRIAKGSLSWIENFLAPIGNFLLQLGGLALTKAVLEWAADEDNKVKLKEFLEKTKFVFDKLWEFGTAIGNAIGTGLDFLFGKESTFEERLDAFGKIALAIGGIGATLAAVNFVSDLFGAADDVADVADVVPDPDPKPKKPTKPTPTNPSGADPDLEGPNKRPKASTIADKYGDLAEKQYKKILAERGDEAARAFANALNDSGGNITQATKKFNRLLKKGAFKPIEPPKPGALQRLGNFFGGALDTGIDLTKRGLGALHRGLKGLPAWAGEQYKSLSSAAKTGWDNTVKAGEAIANKGKKWASAAGNALKGGFDALSNGAKNFFLEKIMAPIKGIIDPIAKKASGIGQALFDRLKGLPGMEKAGEILKKKGIGGFGDIAQAGSKLGKRAAAILPVIGGIVNLAFAYDRAANGDSIGALIEGTSGILDIAGLATAGAGNVASMLLDGYMFVRDFLPQLQEGEEKVVDAVGARGLKDGIDNLLSKLPNIGELINMFMGKTAEQEPNDGVLDLDTQEANKVVANEDTISQEALDMVDQYSRGGHVQPQEMFLGGIVKGAKKAFGGIGKAVSGIASNPLVQTAASFIPGAAPIMAGINMATGLMSGNPMNMLGAAAGMIPGLSGMMGSVGNAIGGFMNSPLGQIGGSLLSGNFMGAATTGLGMINPALGQMAGSLMSGGLGGVAKQFGMGGIYEAVTGAMGGDYNSALSQIGSELGVDPKVLGAVQSTSQEAMKEGGISAQYAMQQTMEFIPIPMIMEKLVPIPQAVPINNGGGIVNAVPTSLQTRMR
ncbi:endolysin [Synechococcus phage S-CAM22]|uniref:Uncharacterized protein n=1 Tax=Synechococcus phage S-CAM22 TaxID=1883365 RepID=A0A1D8KQH5_9CAUD|nr:endolysin [Synechococcus phage S-CAM22]AOV60844.1 hypothetical protein C350210_012 [Synechococcus phage S-CAM22]